MAVFGNGPAAMISGIILAAGAAAAALFTLGKAPQSETETVREDVQVSAQAAPAEESADAKLALNVETDIGGDDEPAPSAAPVSLDFSLGSVDDLRNLRAAPLLEKIDSVPGVAEKTKVWVASADVASAPGDETFYHIKGPLTCGRIGCDLIVAGASGSILLETVGEDISSPAMNTLIINQGSGTAVTWVFDGAEFVEKR